MMIMASINNKANAMRLKRAYLLIRNLKEYLSL